MSLKWNQHFKLVMYVVWHYYTYFLNIAQAELVPTLLATSIQLNKWTIERKPTWPEKVVSTKQAQKCLTSKELRSTEGSFTSRKIQLDSGIQLVPNRKMRRFLNNERYKYMRSRKKGLFTASDLKNRMSLCCSVKQCGLHAEFWCNVISMYLEGKYWKW